MAPVTKSQSALTARAGPLTQTTLLRDVCQERFPPLIDLVGAMRVADLAEISEDDFVEALGHSGAAFQHLLRSLYNDPAVASAKARPVMFQSRKQDHTNVVGLRWPGFPDQGAAKHGTAALRHARSMAPPPKIANFFLHFSVKDGSHLAYLPTFIRGLTEEVVGDATVVLWLRSSTLTNTSAELRSAICDAAVATVSCRLFLNVSGTLLAAASARPFYQRMSDKQLRSFIFVSDTAFVDVSLAAMELSAQQERVVRDAHEEFARLQVEAKTMFSLCRERSMAALRTAADSAACRELMGERRPAHESTAAHQHENTDETTTAHGRMLMALGCVVALAAVVVAFIIRKPPPLSRPGAL